MKQPFNPGDRTYYVSDERLRAFRALTPEQRLDILGELIALVHPDITERRIERVYCVIPLQED